MLSVKRAEIADISRIKEIYEGAQDFMIRSGNPDQWGRFYPTAEMIESDITEGESYVIFDESGIHGVVALTAKEEPTYREIYGGAWLNDEPYITVHRIAGDGKVHGIFRCVVDHCKGISDNIRIDTHEKNLVMQRLIEGSGFKKCGTIYVRDRSPRIAYQWSRE